jgi:hypothetical protein
VARKHFQITSLQNYTLLNSTYASYHNSTEVEFKHVAAYLTVISRIYYFYPSKQGCGRSGSTVLVSGGEMQDKDCCTSYCNNHCIFPPPGQVDPPPSSPESVQEAYIMARSHYILGPHKELVIKWYKMTMPYQ